MHRRALIAALPLALLARAASAGETKAAAGQYVDMAPVALPIVVDNRLVNYVFVYIRINLRPSVDALRMRDREPDFRDALVRLGHRTPFVLKSDYSKLDEARLKAAFLPAATAIAGTGAIASIEIMPGGGAMRRVGLPKPATPNH
ncbi:MAG TPA: hypothetical protein VFE13_20810 [Caulobacteraceae bacterium]|jgi:hypothetical protein|nr:hypothetical protein [Caulobacteraceae bacterium]